MVSQAVTKNLPFPEIMLATTDHVDVRLSVARSERAGATEEQQNQQLFDWSAGQPRF
jgi:hypothetical protein